MCHTLPYACNYVREGDTSRASTATRDKLQHQNSAVSIRDTHGEIGSPSLLHPPSLSKDTEVPAETNEGHILSPGDKLYNAPRHQSGEDIAKAEYFPEQVAHDKSKYRWVLTPRRDHAALNSGTKSIAQETEVILVAWPVEVHDVDGNKIGAGTLTEKEKAELEQGFRSLVSPKDKAGILCVPVWMDDNVSNDLKSKEVYTDIEAYENLKIADSMYFDYCKSYLWPTFHYLGLSDHQSKEKLDKAWNAYYAANKAYADRVAEVYKEGDLVGQEYFSRGFSDHF